MDEDTNAILATLSKIKRYSKYAKFILMLRLMFFPFWGQSIEITQIHLTAIRLMSLSENNSALDFVSQLLCFDSPFVSGAHWGTH